jgi:hypothetical protein
MSSPLWKPAPAPRLGSSRRGRYAAKGELFYRDSATFFRQAPGETWEPVIKRAADALGQWAQAKASPAQACCASRPGPH